MTPELLRYGSREFSSRDFFRSLQGWDLVCVFLPIILFHVLDRLRSLSRLKWALLLLVCSYLFLNIRPARLDPPAELTSNPMFYFGRELWKGMQSPPNRFARRGDVPTAAQMRSLQWVDPAFVGSPRPAPVRILATLAPPAGWNVLIFILESTGSAYVFDRNDKGEVPMPFLERMAAEGLNFGSHWAASNTSTRAAFSLFTGLYPTCEPADWSVSQEVALPTLNRFLGSKYNCFMVHPTSMGYFFPKPLLQNSK